MSTAERKAVIKHADMNEEMQQDAIDCANVALEKFNIEKDIAAYIKKEFDKKYNPTLPTRPNTLSTSIWGRLLSCSSSQVEMVISIPSIHPHNYTMLSDKFSLFIKLKLNHILLICYLNYWCSYLVYNLEITIILR